MIGSGSVVTAGSWLRASLTSRRASPYRTPDGLIRRWDDRGHGRLAGSAVLIHRVVRAACGAMAGGPRRLRGRAGDAETAVALDGLAQARWWMSDVSGAVDAWERAYTTCRREGLDEPAAHVAVLLSREHARGPGQRRARQRLARPGKGPSGRLPRLDRVGVGGPRRVRTSRRPEARPRTCRARARHGPTARRCGPGDRRARQGRTRRDRPGPHRGGDDPVRPGHGRQRRRRVGRPSHDRGPVLRGEPRRGAHSGREPVRAVDQSDHEVHAADRPSRSADILRYVLRRGASCGGQVGGRGGLAHPDAQPARAERSAGPMRASGDPAGRVPRLAGQVGGGRAAAPRLRGPPRDRPGDGRPASGSGSDCAGGGPPAPPPNETGRDSLVAVPLLAQLVEVQLAQPDLAGAAETADSLAAIAAGSGQARAQAEAELALGSVRASAHDVSDARVHLDRSLGLFVRLRMPHAAGRVHLALARALADVDPDTAIEEARQALRTFEDLGATHDADRAAALLRTLGVAGEPVRSSWASSASARSRSCACSARA